MIRSTARMSRKPKSTARMSRKPKTERDTQARATLVFRDFVRQLEKIGPPRRKLEGAR
jgi:hypothetical protein